MHFGDWLNPVIRVVGVTLFVIVWIALCISITRERNRVAQTRVEEWANSEGLVILHLSQRFNILRILSWPRPWIFTVSNKQRVYRVEVEDRAGMFREGWVRCGGSWIGGLWSDRVEVRWDEPEKRAKPDPDLWDRDLDG